jgi:hypothetical protein
LVGSPWHGGGRQLGAAREESVALGQFGEEEGHPPRPVGRLGHMGHAGRLTGWAKSQGRILSNLNRIFRY